MWMYVARLRYKTSTVLSADYRTSQLSKQETFQVTSKLAVPNSLITHILSRWIPDCWTDRHGGTRTKRAATNTWYSHLMDSGRSQMTATGNVGDPDTVISEIRWWRDSETTVNGRSKLVFKIKQVVWPVVLPPQYAPPPASGDLKLNSHPEPWLYTKLTILCCF